VEAVSTPVPPGAPGVRRRIASIDQFRGYAILGMVFVNFVSRFDATPWMLKHHRFGMSYNDTIAPIFMFVVGMGFRLSLMRHIETVGLRTARIDAAKRYLILTLIGAVVYFGYFWDALTDIGIGGLLALPLMDKSRGIRVLGAAASLALFQCLFSLTPYGDWLMANSLNGGPLGPLSWASILLAGSVAYDMIAAGTRREIVLACLGWGLGLAALGFILKAEWPGIKPAWPFSQYGMTAPYPLYATGLAFLTYLAFYLICDVAGWRLPHLTVLGENPLALYAVHGILIAIGLLILKDSAPVPAIVAGTIVLYLCCYALARWLHHKKIFFKI